VCRIVVDVAVVRALRALGCEIEVASLVVGDYVVAHGVVVERKTVRDLHLTVVNGRFWRQIGGLRAGAARPYLLIEGTDLDAGPLAPNAVRGVCLAVVEQDVPIIRSAGPADSALWLARLARRSILVRPAADRPVYAQRPAPHAPAEAALAAVPGISVVLARRLLERFGSVAGVIAGRDEWATVEGMGTVRTRALESAFLH
jgi:DNA excision repair protein ERCC-4